MLCGVRKSICAIALAVLPSAALQAQSEGAEQPVADTAAAASLKPLSELMEAAPVKATTASVMTKSPMGAFWRSALVPGWGQLYNEQYWKAPIAFGAAAYFTYSVLRNQSLYADAAAAYDRALASGTDDRRLLLDREFYRDLRDQNAVYLSLTWAVSLIDAYVGAHLYDFDVSDDLSARVELSAMPLCLGFTLRW